MLIILYGTIPRGGDLIRLCKKTHEEGHQLENRDEK
jgi:hypothetical protein